MESAGAGLLAELFSWIGLCAGAVFALAWFASWLYRSLWREADAVVIGEGDVARLRWIDEHHRVTERALEHWELEQLGGAGHARILHLGGRARLKGSPHVGRALGVLAIVFLSVGMAAVAASLVLMALG